MEKTAAMIKTKLLCCAAIIFILFGNGCAYLRSQTTRSTDSRTGTPTEQTIVRCYTVFDSQSALTKFSNSSSLTTNGQWSPGTRIGTLDQSATSTNLNQLIGIIIESAVKGARAAP